MGILTFSKKKLSKSPPPGKKNNGQKYLYVMYADSSQFPLPRTVDFNDGGGFVTFVSFVMSSTVSEGFSDNLILVQEVFGE